MPHPLLYEINTRCWLRDLSDSRGASITLANVPDQEPAHWRALGFTHVWAMGVWTTGPRCHWKALNSPGLRSTIAKIPGEWRDEDIVASPYAIADYQVARALGGDAGLAIFRKQLHAHGLKLLLDFVPNHLGLDHPWVTTRRHLFVGGAKEFTGAFLQETVEGTLWFAHGKDPYFPPWDDTVQLDYRRPETRAAMTDVLRSIAQRCDGVRCDMAMLLLNDVFAKTWVHLPHEPEMGATPHPSGSTEPAEVPLHGLMTPHPTLSPSEGAREKRHAVDSDVYQNPLAGSGVQCANPSGNSFLAPDAPASEFWTDAISDVKQDYPRFLFLAESYWGLEARLHSLGFDYTYHKTVTDFLVARSPAHLQQHLLAAEPEFLARCAHFLENHDEPRAAETFSLAEHRVAALFALALPGMRFLHEGQLRGARIQIPVQLARWPGEPPDPESSAIYARLLAALRESSVGAGEWKMLSPLGWPDNLTARNIIAIQWQSAPGEFDLAVVNLASHTSQCRLKFEIPNFGDSDWQLRNRLGDEVYQRAGRDLTTNGLHLELPPHAAQLFHFTIQRNGMMRQ